MILFLGGEGGELEKRLKNLHRGYYKEPHLYKKLFNLSTSRMESVEVYILSPSCHFLVVVILV